MGQIWSIIQRFYTPKDHHHHHHHHDYNHDDQLKEPILPIQPPPPPQQIHSIDIIDHPPKPVSGSIIGTTENDLIIGKNQDHAESVVVPSDHTYVNNEVIVDIKVVEDAKVIHKKGLEVKRIGQYTSSQRILLVGEGDFSFSASLAVAFGSSSNIVATSLNTQEFLEKNYGNFPNNKMELVSRGSVVLHGVNATKMAKHHRLRNIKFDRIIFNFPHSGFDVDSRELEISRHQKLVSSFLRNAKKMLKDDGEIHVTHKSNGFHLEWDIPNLGLEEGLNLIQEMKFKRSKYPGYCPKYGFGGDKDFDCVPSKTYKFKKNKSIVSQ